MIYPKEHYNLIEKYNLSTPQAEGFLTAYIALESNLNHPIYGNRWEMISAKHSISRIVYEASSTIISGYMTPDAKSIKDNKLLDKDEKTKLITNEHIFSPQTYAHFICSRWDLFEDDLDSFFSHMLLLSTTVKSTVKENNEFKKFTINNATTGNVLQLVVSTENRYKAAGVEMLFNINTGKYVTGFPFKLSDEFLEFERDYLLIGNK